MDRSQRAAAPFTMHQRRADSVVVGEAQADRVADIVAGLSSPRARPLNGKASSEVNAALKPSR